MDDRSIVTSPTTIGDRVKSLFGLRALPGWLFATAQYIWKWFWKLVNWIGNWDTVKDHVGGWHVPVASISRLPSSVLPILGLLWLTIVVVFGDRLRFGRKRTKDDWAPKRQGTHEVSLPEPRPKVVPVKYGPSTDGHFGLYVRNEGELAFDVSIYEVVFGTSRLDFWNEFPSLGSSDGEKLFAAHITLSPGSGMAGSGLRDEMIKQNVEPITVSVRYQGYKQSVVHN